MADSVYEQVGKEGFFAALVDRFYEGVAADPLLRPMHDDAELAPARSHLTLFLVQVFGGPTTYAETLGHPVLRLRHMRFPIDKAARDAWMSHMERVLEDSELDAMTREEIRSYFSKTATFLLNQGLALGGRS